MINRGEVSSFRSNINRSESPPNTNTALLSKPATDEPVITDKKKKQLFQNLSNTSKVSPDSPLPRNTIHSSASKIAPKRRPSAQDTRKVMPIMSGKDVQIQ